MIEILIRIPKLLTPIVSNFITRGSDITWKVLNDCHYVVGKVVLFYEGRQASDI